MSYTYAIGDLHGCLTPLQHLLDKIHYRPGIDKLWFTGDITNRGPQSLETLQFIRALPNSVVVLGNHDLVMLLVMLGLSSPQAGDTFPILSPSDKASAIEWLRHLPVLHHDTTLGFTMTHAGIFPKWDLPQARQLAKELEHALRAPDYTHFLSGLLTPESHSQWEDALTGVERLRFIADAFTRMRFCHRDGRLDFHLKGTLNSVDKSKYVPWFAFSGRRTQKNDLIFGHWSALGAPVDLPHLYPLDSGCVWGKCLTALCVNTQERFTVDCQAIPISREPR